jgi:hypothetical protein
MANDEMNQLLRDRSRKRRFQLVSEDGRGKVVAATDDKTSEKDGTGANDDDQDNHGD